MVTVTLHSDRPAAAIRRWRSTFTDARWRVLRRRPIAVVVADASDLGSQQLRMLAYAEAFGGHVTPSEAR